MVLPKSAVVMRPSRKPTSRKAGSKSQSHPRSNEHQRARGASLVTKLTAARSRWVEISAIMTMIRTGMAKTDGRIISLYSESIARIMFRSVLIPIREEIRWLDELIKDNSDGSSQ
jgi:hypothetical protein